MTVPAWLPRDVGDGFELPNLRNLLAHYELRSAQRFVLGAEQPLMAAVEGLCGLNGGTVRSQIVERLGLISEFLSSGLTKTRLRPLRVHLGKHS